MSRGHVHFLDSKDLRCAICGIDAGRCIHQQGRVAVAISGSGPWEADHDVPLWDGGAHCSSNIVRRCVPCHRAKTAGEATERAARRRQEQGLPEPLPAHHPGQAQLVAA